MGGNSRADRDDFYFEFGDSVFCEVEAFGGSLEQRVHRGDAEGAERDREEGDGGINTKGRRGRRATKGFWVERRVGSDGEERVLATDEHRFAQIRNRRP